MNDSNSSLYSLLIVVFLNNELLQP